MVAGKKKGRTIFALEKENVQYYTTRSTANHKAQTGCDVIKLYETSCPTVEK